MEVEYSREKNALSILEELYGLRETRQHCDFVIKVGTEEIHVHRNILCANSEYFKAMLSHDTSENQTGCVELKDMDADCVLTCADFMYCQEVFVVDEKREKLLSTANFLQLHSFRESIAEYYEENLNENAFYATKKLAGAYHCADLEEKCDSFAVKNFEAVAQLDEYKELTKEYIAYLLESEENNTSANNKVKALLNWVQHDQASRETVLPELLGRLPLPEVSVNYKHYLINEQPLTSECLKCVKLLGNSFMPGLNSRLPTKYERDQSNAIVVFDDATRCLQLFDPKCASLVQKHALREDFLIDTFSAASLGCFIYVLKKGKVVYRLDFSNEEATWERLPDTIEDHGLWPPSVTDRNFIYVASRWMGACNSIEKFDAVENSWEKLTHWNVKNDTTPVILSDSIYCIGGRDIIYGKGDQQNGVTMKTVEIFNINSKEWDTAAPLLHARCRCAGLAHSGKIYIVGGWCGKPVSNAECYDPVSNTWSLLTPMFQCRQASQVFLIGDEIFAVGGYREFPSTMEKYSIEENKWSLAKIPEDRELKILWCVGNLHNLENENIDDLEQEQSDDG